MALRGKGEQVARTVEIIFLLLGMASLFGGIPSALFVFRLRMTRPERRPRVWKTLIAFAAIWTAFALGTALWLAYRFLRHFQSLEGLAVLIKEYPVWLLSCGPALPVLIALLVYKPARRHAANKALRLTRRP